MPRPIPPGEQVVVQTADGPSLATVTRPIPALADRRRPPEDSTARVVRRATHEDVVDQAEAGSSANRRHGGCAWLKIRERGLAMKLTRVEQLFDGSRLIFYYTAEGRVDFRELVRDLAAHFRTRIEMRQIGVRDEARMLGGYGLVRPAAVLHDLAADVRAHLHQDGQAAAAQPQSRRSCRGCAAG